MKIQEILSTVGGKIRKTKAATKADKYPWLKSYPQAIHWDAKITVKPLPQLLEETATRFPEQIAIDFMGQKTTYRDLWRQVQKMAAGLQAMGVRKGTHVGLFLPNSPHFVISYYATLLAGGTVVNFNPLYPVPDLLRQIKDSRVKIMVTFAMHALLGKLVQCEGKGKLETIIVAEFQEALPAPLSWLFPFLKHAEILSMPIREGYVAFSRVVGTSLANWRKVVINPQEDIAVLQYTGGTTGVPKGAMLSHENLYVNAVQCGMWFEGLEEGNERMLGVLPLFHVFAMTVVMNLSIHKGLTMILHPQFNLKRALRDIEKKKPTLLPGVPTMFNAINNFPKLEKYNLRSLKICFSGGAGLPREVKDSFEKHTGCKLVEGYGLSESSPVVSANPLFGENKTGSIGLPLPDTIIEIVATEGRERVLPIGKTGEICIKGPQVMKGYWKKQTETEKTLRDNRLHTGDIGYMDTDGYVFVVDRLKEMIISGGYNIYPRNVEEIIYSHSAVLEAAVVGVDDPHWGQHVKAYIALKPGHTLEESEIIDYLRDRLPRFALPSEVEFRESLPKTLIGKIAKKELK